MEVNKGLNSITIILSGKEEIEIFNNLIIDLVFTHQELDSNFKNKIIEIFELKDELDKMFLPAPVAKNRYEYLVSFKCDEGFGNCVIRLDQIINTVEMIKNATKEIEKDCKLKNVIIMNWKELM